MLVRISKEAKQLAAKVKKAKGEKKLKLSLNLEKEDLLKFITELNKCINDYENSFENVFKLNDYLKLKYEDGSTGIYVDDDYFRQCAYLLLNIPVNEIEDFDEVKSIDDAEHKLSHELHAFHNKEKKEKKYHIDPKQEFIAHCSNMEAWVENDYNTQLLHRTIAFPLLKKLVEVGDPKAKRAYKEELAYRLESNELNVAIFLIKNRYLKDLDNDELEIIIDNMKPGIVKIILQEENLKINFDNKKRALIIVPDEVYLTSYKRNSFTYRNYKKPFNLKFLDKYSRTLYNTLIDFGIIWNKYKILFKKLNILKAVDYFTDKENIKVEIPRSKAPLKLYVEKENLAIFIYPKLMF
ncbi:hypothetical protein LCGC14_1377180 [marine sediment metagenome]|uniref:Uncharacterized protein n=1 Tax=marine sediment metagenome TaxID=412755 RepID=A0A0F9N5H6_9ZZZZ